jgi:hypothetical protein
MEVWAGCKVLASLMGKHALTVLLDGALTVPVTEELVQQMLDDGSIVPFLQAWQAAQDTWGHPHGSGHFSGEPNQRQVALIGFGSQGVNSTAVQAGSQGWIMSSMIDFLGLAVMNAHGVGRSVTARQFHQQRPAAAARQPRGTSTARPRQQLMAWSAPGQVRDPAARRSRG